MVSWPQGTCQKPIGPDALFCSKQWQVSGNAICVVPSEVADDAHPEYQEPGVNDISQQIIVKVSKGKFLALQRSHDLRDGYLE